MEADTLRALIRNDVVNIRGNRRLGGVRIDLGTVHAFHHTLQRGAVGEAPLSSAFVNGVVRTFGFAGAAVDALFGNLDGHTVFPFYF